MFKKIEFKKFEDFFHLQFTLFKFVGIRFNSRDDATWKKWANTFYFGLCYATFSTNVLMILVFLILPEANLVRKVGAFSVMIAEISHLSKLQFIYVNLERIKGMLKMLKDLYDQQKMADHQYLLRNSGVIYRYSRTLVVLSTIFMSIPIMTSLSIYSKKKVWVPLYPIDCWFPLDPKAYYVLIYLYSLYIGLIYAVNMIAGDALLHMILTHITQQLKIISKNYSNLKEHGSDLKVLMERHNSLLK